MAIEARTTAWPDRRAGEPSGMAGNLAAAATALVLLFVLGEAALRALIPPPLPWLDPQTLYQPDPALHYRMRPSQTSFTADKPCRTNSLGLRGGEIAIAKPPGVRRVLVLGDSIAFGFGVAEDATFSHLLEQRLNAEGTGTRWEVINAGQPAFNTTQEVTYFAREGIAFDPDTVIIAVYWNDIHSEMLQHADPNGWLVEGPPDARLGAAEEVAQAPAVRSVRNFVKRSRLLYFVTNRVRVLQARFTADYQSSTFMSVLEGRSDPRVEAGWRRIEADLTQLAGLCRERGSSLLVAIMPMSEALGGRHPRAEYPARILDMCRRHGLRCADLHPPFQQALAGGGSPFIDYDEAHPNEAGHAIIAREVYPALTDR